MKRLPFKKTAGKVSKTLNQSIREKQFYVDASPVTRPRQATFLSLDLVACAIGGDDPTWLECAQRQDVVVLPRTRIRLAEKLTDEEMQRPDFLKLHFPPEAGIPAYVTHVGPEFKHPLSTVDSQLPRSIIVGHSKTQDAIEYGKADEYRAERKARQAIEREAAKLAKKLGKSTYRLAKTEGTKSRDTTAPTEDQINQMREQFVTMGNEIRAGEIGNDTCDLHFPYAELFDHLKDSSRLTRNTGRNCHRRELGTQLHACAWFEVIAEFYLFAIDQKLPRSVYLASREHYCTFESSQFAVPLGTIDESDSALAYAADHPTTAPTADLKEQLGERGLRIASLLGANLTEGILRSSTLKGAFAMSCLSPATCKRRIAAARLTMAMESGVTIGQQEAGRIDQHVPSQRETRVEQWQA